MAELTKRASSSEPKFAWADLGRAIWFFLKKESRLPFLGWGAALAASSLLTLLPAYLMGQMIAFLAAWKPGGPMDTFHVLAVVSGLAHFGNSQLRIYSKYRLGLLRIGTVKETKISGFARILLYPLEWHSREDVGTRLQRLQAGAEGVNRTLQSLVQNAVPTFIPIIGMAAVFISLDWRLCAFCVIYLGVSIANEVRFFRPSKEAADRRNKAGERSSGTSFEMASSVLTLKALGAEESKMREIIQREEGVEETSIARLFTVNSKWRYFSGFNGLATGAFLVLLGIMFQEGNLGIAMVYTTYMYLGRLMDGVANASDLVTSGTDDLSAVGCMMPLFRDEIPEEKGTLPFPRDWQEIRVVEGRFTYPGKTHAALRGINMRFGKGEITGIAGASGGGKSTLASLILGLHPLTEGVIEVDGVPLEAILRGERTSRLTVVLQKTEMFNSSVRENITLCQDVPEEMLAKAIKIAQLEPVIEGMPEGIDTIIGPKGARISGGEAQRIGIARALCIGADAIILDEATSSLDPETERAIQIALEQEVRETGMALVVIAHRISTLANADHVYVLRQGEVIEQGSFATLAVGDGYFANLCKLSGSHA